jgi:hypothetical protein
MYQEHSIRSHYSSEWNFAAMMISENGGGHLLSIPGKQGQTSKIDSIKKQHSITPATKTKNGCTTVRKRHGARNQDRHKIFVKWLSETFDLSHSRVPDATENDSVALFSQHILDVAGGRGEVSARLTMCERQRVVMVDPRPADVVDCFEKLVLPKIPNKWQLKLEQQRQDDTEFVRNIVGVRFRQLVTTFDEATLSSCTELQAAVENASLLLGLHADGATEAIVDAALRNNKPFVVVPCCVFPNFFSKRFINEEGHGAVPVRTHEQFCKYLAEKDSRLVLGELPFAGRNIAIWWNGK